MKSRWLTFPGLLWGFFFQCKPSWCLGQTLMRAKENESAERGPVLLAGDEEGQPHAQSMSSPGRTGVLVSSFLGLELGSRLSMRKVHYQKYIYVGIFWLLLEFHAWTRTCIYMGWQVWWHLEYKLCMIEMKCILVADSWKALQCTPNSAALPWATPRPLF